MKILLSLLLIAFPLIATAQDVETESEIVCENTSTCSIPYETLSSQETDPFLFLGRTMDENHPRWNQYRRALFEFPEARDCLIEEEQRKTEPNLLLINWKQIGTGRGAEVCIFRIVSSLGTPEKAVHWLEFQGFETIFLQRIGSEREKQQYETQPWFNMSGHWTVEQYREVNPSWLSRMFGVEPVYTYRVILMFSKDETIVGVSAGAQVE